MCAFGHPSVSLRLSVGGGEVHDVGNGVTVGKKETTLSFKRKIQHVYTCIYSAHTAHN